MGGNMILFGLMMLFLLLDLQLVGSVEGDKCFSSTYMFGDSYLDIGNKAALYPEAFQQKGAQIIQSNKYPYGISFSNHSTGRFSDGRMIGDFIAQRFGLHLPGAYFQSSASYIGGVNFAVGSITALSPTHPFFIHHNISLELPFSLMDEFGWYLGFMNRESYYTSLLANCSSTALYVVGEIGGNDYSMALFLGGVDPLDIPSTLTPLVIQTIQTFAENLYSSGARNFLFIGLPPMVDSPGYSAVLSFLNKEALYNLTSIHNVLLRKLVGDFKANHSDVFAAFADFEGIHKDVVRNSTKYGFTDISSACCGGPGAYNFNMNISCGQPGFIMCPNPKEYLYWDFSHYSEHFARIAAKAFVLGDYLEPPNAFITKCGFNITLI